jgi:Rieske Fe-S protein
MDEDRRKFCQATCAALCAAALPIPLAGCQKAAGSDVWTITSFKAGDVMMNEALLAQVADPNNLDKPSHNFYFCRDAGGLYVIDANCTHARCVLVFSPVDTDNMHPLPSFDCSCHGSTFDYNGQNPTPPAPTPLVHYQLTVEPDGTLVVDAGTTVTPDIRVAG